VNLKMRKQVVGVGGGGRFQSPEVTQQENKEKENA
jgi:hypothetical protein